MEGKEKHSWEKLAEIIRKGEGWMKKIWSLSIWNYKQVHFLKKKSCVLHITEFAMLSYNSLPRFWGIRLGLSSPLNDVLKMEVQ